MGRHSKCKFQEIWLGVDSPYKSWIARSRKGDDHEAHCILCNKGVSVASMGESALRKHIASKKHLELLSASNKTLSVAQMFSQSCEDAAPSSNAAVASSSHSATATTISTSNSPPDSHVSASSSSLSQTVVSSQVSLMTAYISNDKTTEAEILWCLNSVMCYFSCRSSSSSVSLMARMFPDSTIAQGMRLGKDKLRYNITHGIAPYFRQQLISDLTAAHYFVVLFDESMNKISQKGQMDIYIRYLKAEKVLTRYLTSVFLLRAKSENLIDAFHEGTVELAKEKIIQIGMDGPQVNHKFLRLMKTARDEEALPPFIDIGTCSLHIVSGALKTADECNEYWNVGIFLSSCYYVFHDSPMRKAVFLNANGINSSLFPLKMCRTRWVENVTVASRGILLLPKLKLYVDEVVSTKSEPKIKSFQCVKSNVSDTTLILKLTFFHSIASSLNEFLTVYQTDAPMLPFMFTDLTGLITYLMKKVAKEELILGKSIKSIVEVDLHEPRNLKASKDIDLGYAVADEIRKNRNSLSKEDISKFRKMALLFLTTLISKLQERCPLKYPMVKGATCLDPKIMISRKNEGRLDIALKELVFHQRLTGSECDAAKIEFLRLASDPVVIQKGKDFNKSQDRLDGFWLGQLLKLHPETDPLKKMVCHILVLSHGQASVERGFNINKEMIVENQMDQSFIAMRFVHDHVNKLGVPLVDIIIPKGLVNSVRAARTRYHNSLEERQKIKESKEESEKAAQKRLRETLEEKIEQRKRMKSDALALDKEISVLKQKS